MAHAVPTATPNTNYLEGTITVHGAPPDTDLYFRLAMVASSDPYPRGETASATGPRNSAFLLRPYTQAEMQV
jgi:hypothetical protein